LSSVKHLFLTENCDDLHAYHNTIVEKFVVVKSNPYEYKSFSS